MKIPYVANRRGLKFGGRELDLGEPVPDRPEGTLAGLIQKRWIVPEYEYEPPPERLDDLTRNQLMERLRTIGVDPEKLKGTGTRGYLKKEDLIRALQHTEPQPA